MLTVTTVSLIRDCNPLECVIAEGSNNLSRTYAILRVVTSDCVALATRVHDFLALLKFRCVSSLVGALLSSNYAQHVIRIRS